MSDNRTRRFVAEDEDLVLRRPEARETMSLRAEVEAKLRDLRTDENPDYNRFLGTVLRSIGPLLDAADATRAALEMDRDLNQR